MSRSSVRLEGYALHAGIPTALTLRRVDGPLTFAQGARSSPLASLRVARSDLGVKLTDDQGLSIDLVEHLMASLGGLGIRDGIRAEIEGPEVPLLDGGAQVISDALRKIDAPPSPSRLFIARRETLRVGASVYELEESSETELHVEIEFDHPAIGQQQASWKGDVASFLEDIAPARTFGFLEQAEDLFLRSRALLFQGGGVRSRVIDTREASMDAVLVFDAREHVPLEVEGRRSEPPRPNELARHKLLDLIGDLAIYGGPPAGILRALRPGHGATHEVLRTALARGIVAVR